MKFPRYLFLFSSLVFGLRDEQFRPATGPRPVQIPGFGWEHTDYTLSFTDATDMSAACPLCYLADLFAEYPDIDPDSLTATDRAIYFDVLELAAAANLTRMARECGGAVTADAAIGAVACRHYPWSSIQTILRSSASFMASALGQLLAAVEVRAGARPGRVEGYPRARLDNGDTITGIAAGGLESFKGIPFAEPPVGALRFRHPQPYRRSVDGLFAREFGPSCINVTPLGFGSILRKRAGVLPECVLDAMIKLYFKSAEHSGEDCLYLNVFRPRGVRRGAKLPVVVWFYGGAFQFGSATHYPADKFIETSRQMGSPIIFVTFNYRLGPWGFLGGPVVQAEGSANAGLLDQRLALEWVADNIESFGGDPGRVTVMGESAGAISIAFHMVSNYGDLEYKGKPLFHGAILQSGGAWVFDSVSSAKPASLFWRFAEYSGCGGVGEEEVMSCLRAQDSERLRVAQNFNEPVEDATYEELGSAFFGWSPRFDGGFIPESPVELFRKQQFAQVPVITGNQEDEGTILTLLFDVKTEGDLVRFARRMFSNTSRADVDRVVGMYRGGQRGSVYRKVMRPGAVSGFAEMVGDIIFHVPRMIQVQSTPAHVPVYVFMARHLRMVPVVGTVHSNEILYQFYLDVYPAEVYRRHFVSFINHFDPNVGTGLPVWRRYTRRGRRRLDIVMTGSGEGVDTVHVARDKNIHYLVENPGLVMI